jgi:hypothetical protein
MVPFSLVGRMPVCNTAISCTNNLNTALRTSDRKPTCSRVFPFRINTKSCLVSTYRHVGGTYCVHIQCSWYGEIISPLKTEPVYPFEMLVPTFQNANCQNLEDHTINI